MEEKEGRRGDWGLQVILGGWGVPARRKKEEERRRRRRIRFTIE